MADGKRQRVRMGVCIEDLVIEELGALPERKGRVWWDERCWLSKEGFELYCKKLLENLEDDD